MNGKRKIRAVLCALSLCLAACDDEVLPVAGEDRPLAEGEFVVDYAADGLDTRSIHGGVPENIRISSLTYLLYGIEGNLLKRREIPGIDENTVWPLRRETMTWAQREALKDTLDTRRMNAVAFVANVDPEKCGWKDVDGNPSSPLRNAENFNQAYLMLPLQPFTDRNMFYIFTCDTLLTDMESVGRDRPLNYPVMLHRAVTRTDFFREQLPEWESIDNVTPEALPQPGDTVYQYMAYYAKSIFSENLNPKEVTNITLVGSLINEQKGFLQVIYQYFFDQSKGFYNNIKKIQDYLDLHKETAQSYLLVNERSEAILGTMVKDCLANPELRRRWKASWCMGKRAQLVYKGNAGVNQFMLNKHTANPGATESAHIEVDTSIVVTDPIYKFNTLYSGFSHIGFANPEQNILSAIHWYAEDLTNPFSSLSTGDLTTRQNGNEWYEVRYNPMLPLSYNVSSTDPCRSYQSVYDLNGLPFKEALNDGNITEEELDKLVSDLKEAIQDEALPNFSDADKVKYFGEGKEPSLANVQLTIHYPDLSEEAALVFNERWDIRKVQGR